MTKLTNNLYIYYFDSSNPLRITTKMVLVSNSPDDDVAQHLISAYDANPCITNFDTGFIITEKTFNAVLVPMIKEVGALLSANTLVEEDDTMNTIKELKTWVMSDDDCFQHMKKLTTDGMEWKMVQIYQSGCPGNEHKYYAGCVEVNLNDYLDPVDEDSAEVIIDILSGYGYDEFIFGEDYTTEVEHYKLIVNNIKEIYGDSYLQIIAECIAEYQLYADYYIIEPKNAVSFNQAKDIAYEYMKGDDN